MAHHYLLFDVSLLLSDQLLPQLHMLAGLLLAASC
jgi:hypothetical protein